MHAGKIHFHPIPSPQLLQRFHYILSIQVWLLHRFTCFPSLVNLRNEGSHPFCILCPERETERKIQVGLQRISQICCSQFCYLSRVHSHLEKPLRDFYPFLPFQINSLFHRKCGKANVNMWRIQIMVFKCKQFHSKDISLSNKYEAKLKPE